MTPTPITTQRGFTLIELMIVVAIIGVLAAIAYPSYNNYGIQTRRSDAQVALTRIATAQEKYRSDCGYYAATLNGGRSCGTVGTAATSILGYIAGAAPVLSPDGHYVLTVAPGPVTPQALACAGAVNLACGYIVIADPDAVGASGRQRGNGRLRIDSTGRQEWDKAKDGLYSAKWTSK